MDTERTPPRVPALRSAGRLSAIDGDTPTLRLIALLEVIAARDRVFSLQDMADETRLPKPTLHRMLAQLESAGLLQREGDGRHYGTGVRLRRLAENLLLNDTFHGARRAVLRHLVDALGESCNLTALAGSEVVYLDRVETAAPLRFYLHPGSRVPAHCSASGKLFLAQMSPAQRRRLTEQVPLERYTPGTLVDAAALEAEIARVRRDGYAIDNEEFLPGLLCIAVAVPARSGRSRLAVAVQAPVMRFTPDRALQCLPALQRAAAAIAAIEQDAPVGGSPGAVGSGAGVAAGVAAEIDAGIEPGIEAGIEADPGAGDAPATDNTRIGSTGMMIDVDSKRTTADGRPRRRSGGTR